MSSVFIKTFEYLLYFLFFKFVKKCIFWKKKPRFFGRNAYFLRNSTPARPSLNAEISLKFSPLDFAAEFRHLCPCGKRKTPPLFKTKNHFPRKISAAVLPRRYLFSIKNNTLHERCGNADSPCANSYTGTRCVITLHKRRGKPQTRCKRPHTNKSRHANRVDPLSPRPLLRAERRCARLPARRLSLPKGLPFS